MAHGGIEGPCLGTWRRPPVTAGFDWLRLGQAGPPPSGPRRGRQLEGVVRHLLETWGHPLAASGRGWLRMGQVGLPALVTHQGRKFGWVGRHFLGTRGRLRAGLEMGREGLPSSVEVGPRLHPASHVAGCRGVSRHYPCLGPQTNPSLKRQHARAGRHCYGLAAGLRRGRGSG